MSRRYWVVVDLGMLDSKCYQNSLYDILWEIKYYIKIEDVVVIKLPEGHIYSVFK